MTQYNIDTRQGLPTELQILLRMHPRDTWPDHPNFAASVQNWMGAHSMFRQLGRISLSDTETFLDKGMSVDAYAGRLAHFGDLLVRNLHGHHHWEDRSFFPELAAADPRLDRGLDMLEGDHVALGQLLDQFTRGSNRVVQLAHLDPAQVMGEVGPVHQAAQGLTRFLDRHLTDEEELAVPIILHHALRG
jgi:hypothetical protein